MMIATPLFSMAIQCERTSAETYRVVITGWLKIFNIDWHDWGFEKRGEAGQLNLEGGEDD